MKIILISALILSFQTWAQSVPQAAIDIITREEAQLVDDRFTGKLECSGEEVPRCTPIGAALYNNWAKVFNARQGKSGACLVSKHPDKAPPNSYGVTDQWACLTRHQEIREDIWKKRHEAFFAADKFVPPDYFEIKAKYPRAVMNPYTIITKEALFIDYKCAKLSHECARHFRIVLEWLLKLPLNECSVARQGDADAASQCMAFAYEVMNKSFKNAEAEGYKPDTIPNVAVDNWFNRWGDTHIVTIKFNFDDLKHARDDLPASEQFAGNPLAIIYNRIMDRLAAAVKKNDPSYDVSFVRADDKPRGDLSRLAVKPVVTPIGVIRNPDAMKIPLIVTPTFNHEGKGPITLKGDFSAPGAAMVIAKISPLSEETDELLVNWNYRNGKPFFLPDAIAIGEVPSSVATNPVPVTEAPQTKEKPLVLATETKLPRSLEQSLEELATLHAKVQIVSDLNCAGESGHASCGKYRIYLEQTVPHQLGVLCKDEACRQNYLGIQASTLSAMKARMYPELDDLTAEGVFVDPFKVSEAYRVASKEKEAFNKTVRPYLAKIVSRRALPQVEWTKDVRDISPAVCSEESVACTRVVKKIANYTAKSSSTPQGYQSSRRANMNITIETSPLRLDSEGSTLTTPVAAPANSQATVETATSSSATVDGTSAGRASLKATKRTQAPAAQPTEAELKELKEASDLFKR